MKVKNDSDLFSDEDQRALQMYGSSEKPLVIAVIAVLAAIVLVLLNRKKKPAPTPAPSSAARPNEAYQKQRALDMMRQQFNRLAAQGAIPVMNGKLLNAPSVDVPGLTSTGVQFSPGDTNNESFFDPLTTEMYEPQDVNPRKLMFSRSPPYRSQLPSNFVGPL